MEKDSPQTRWNAFMDSLRTGTDGTACIDLDPDKEIAYLQNSRARFLRVFSLIPDCDRPLSLLDIGTTPFIFYIQQQYPRYQIHALDRTDLLADRCRARGIGFHTCDLDARSIPLADASFDVILFTEILEHIFAPPTEILRELFRILRPGGTLILSVPNLATLVRRIKFLFGRSPLDPPDEQMKLDWVHGHGHIREYTRQEIIGLLRNCHFRIDRCEYLESATDRAAGRRPGRAWHRWIEPFYGLAVRLFAPFRPVILLECRKGADGTREQG
ncbi:MAG: class I SAM-dependent methyltransferase [Sedimentisphaerales bacterium]|nr:class I SAM-dependent methyltransferase [Sedimentisphaerales bacterium]